MVTLVYHGAYVRKVYREVQYGVNVNYGCISEDNVVFLKMDYSQKSTEH